MSVESIYPAGPSEVPANLTKATAKYRQHAWLAVFGLLLFILVYFTLAAWFSWGAYHIIVETSKGLRDPLLGYLVGGCSGFLGIFMIKALFFVKHSGENTDLEVTQAAEPKLFDFLFQLADEAGAPRPHRVYLSPRVNACVFYDLSIMNFFFSSKKNLEIGLPLVNCLNLGELKAVLAHEFGHFAQKSMAVGRWVYIAQQIAAHIISKRDFLDRTLSFISRIDIRVAWVGWIMSLIVWSLRAVMESIFSIVVIAQRALSREMEFQADLVAVSLTGSDALIHALYKLQSADDAWQRSLDFVNSEVTAKRGVLDLFAVQDKITEKMRHILDDKNYGKVEPLPAENRAAYRLFKDQIAQPPKMWATHPENNEREENAKKNYVVANIDETSAWNLFENANQLKLDVTADMLKELEYENSEMETTDKNLDSYYDYRFLNPSYKGTYMGRDLTRHTLDASELYQANEGQTPEVLLSQLYPPKLKRSLKKLKNLNEENATLCALRDGFLKTQGGVIKHRGNEYPKKELKSLIEEQQKEISEIENEIHQHDKLCRNAHLQAAKIMRNGWSEYLKGLIAVLHYSEHSLAEISDMRGLFNNVVAVVLADGNVSSRELKKLIKTGIDVCSVLQNAYDSGKQLQLDASLNKRLKIESWSENIGNFDLPHPNKENINDWMQAVDSWFDSICYALDTLRTETLEQLLVTESYVGHKYQQKEPAAMTYGVSKAPEEYNKLLPGNERKLQKKLGLWDRFQTADGFFGAFLRFSVSGGIVGSVLWFSLKLILWNEAVF